MVDESIAAPSLASKLTFKCWDSEMPLRIFSSDIHGGLHDGQPV